MISETLFFQINPKDTDAQETGLWMHRACAAMKSTMAWGQDTPDFKPLP